MNQPPGHALPLEVKLPHQLVLLCSFHHHFFDLILPNGPDRQRLKRSVSRPPSDLGIPRIVYPFAIVTRSRDRAGVSSRSKRGRSADHRNRITDRHELGTLSPNSGAAVASCRAGLAPPATPDYSAASAVGAKRRPEIGDGPRFSGPNADCVKAPVPERIDGNLSRAATRPWCIAEKRGC